METFKLETNTKVYICEQNWFLENKLGDSTTGNQNWWNSGLWIFL